MPQQGLSFPDPVIVQEHHHQNITGSLVSVGTPVSPEEVLKSLASLQSLRNEKGLNHYYKQNDCIVIFVRHGIMKF